MKVYRVYWKGAKLPSFETTSKNAAYRFQPKKEKVVEIITRYNKKK